MSRTRKAVRTTLRRTLLKACGAMIGAGSVYQIASCTARPSVKWVAFYGQIADEQLLSSYDIVVLDPGFKGSIAEVAKAGARVCAYLSLGEIRSTDPFCTRVDSAALLEENSSWPGTFRIDVRHQSWKSLVLDQIIPDIVFKGFTGLLLDTLDTPPYLEQIDPDGNRGMRQAATDLVQSIRKSYSDLLVFINRGYALLPGVAACIDGIVAESFLTTSNPGGNDSYKWNEDSQVSLQLSLLAPARYRRLPTLSLDYWDPADLTTISEIYARERRLGHHPYVATRMLDNIIPEPG
jgi:uncharacterized protein (TIGR01370 family)